MSRIETREQAFRFLFQYGFRTDPVAEQMEIFKDMLRQENESEENKDIEVDFVYFTDLVYGVINYRDTIDSKFVPFLNKWKLERLPQADRVILEIAVYEIVNMEDIPTSVSINEAVKLAKKYGTDSSSSYINGVLSSFEKSL